MVPGPPRTIWTFADHADIRGVQITVPSGDAASGVPTVRGPRSAPLFTRSSTSAKIWAIIQISTAAAEANRLVADDILPDIPFRVETKRSALDLPSKDQAVTL
jgi:hypothetical protein